MNEISNFQTHNKRTLEDCRIATDQIFAVLSGEETDDDALAKHLGSCSFCRETFGMLRRAPELSIEQLTDQSCTEENGLNRPATEKPKTLTVGGPVA